jgi:hypothetical protein
MVFSPTGDPLEKRHQPGWNSPHSWSSGPTPAESFLIPDFANLCYTVDQRRTPTMKNYRPQPQFGRKEKTTQSKPLGYRLRLVGGKLVTVPIGKGDKK